MKGEYIWDGIIWVDLDNHLNTYLFCKRPILQSYFKGEGLAESKTMASGYMKS
jgi:hypothetical protein